MVVIDVLFPSIPHGVHRLATVMEKKKKRNLKNQRNKTINLIIFHESVDQLAALLF